jgi:hypothetical protein
VERSSELVAVDVPSVRSHHDPRRWGFRLIAALAGHHRCGSVLRQT